MGILFLAGTVTASAGPACCGANAAEHGNRGNPEKAEKAEAKGLFGGYEKLSAALVADDLETFHAEAEKLAKLAGKKEKERLGEILEEVGEAGDLEKARESFIPLSREFVMLAAGEEGHYVMSCPMVENGKWLQSDDQVRNPYMGQSMPACGGVEMETADVELAGCCEERRACCAEAGGCCPV